MTIHNFLLYWSDHNDLIIKVLIALSLFIIIFLAFRLFFGAESPAGAAAAAGHVDGAQLEKTLQKILEAQGKAPVFAVPKEGTASAAGGSAAAPAEMEALKKELVEKEKQLVTAKQEAAKSGGGTANPAGALGQADENIAKLEAKIKDLEARLAEYEIISEDIADLSFYKEENVRLQTELSSQKVGRTPAPVASAAAPAATIEPAALESVEPPAPMMAEPQAPMMAEPPASVPPAETSAVEPTPAEVVAALIATPAVSTTAPDDDLMKEFAKAVEEQKGATGEVAPDKESAENTQLMNQFENFVKKT